MTNNLSKPQIRFKGFTEAWEQRKLGDILKSQSINIDFNPEKFAKYEVIQQGNEPIAGYSNNAPFRNYKQIVLFGDHTLSLYKPKSPFLVASDGVKAYFLDNVNGNYLYHLLSFNLPKNEGYKRYSSILKDKDIKLTYNKNEEDKISILLDNLDNLITLHQRKYEKLQQIKKSLLAKMFPAEGDSTPKIRFKGFTEAWEQRKLDTIADVRDGTHDSPQYVKTGHPFITSKNVKDGFINYDDIQFVSDKDYKEINNRSKVDKNDILMGMIGTIGNIALVRETPDFAIKNVALIKDIGNVYYRYLYHCLQSNSVVNQLGENLDGGTQKFIALNKVRELVIPVPSAREQHKIGDYMESLDNLITLHQRKCEMMKNIKKTLLDKMFA